MHITLHGSSVCMRASFHVHVIHDERLIVRSLLLPRSVFLRVSLRRLPLLFHTLPALWPALLPPCGQRRGKHPLRLRPRESITPWRYTILPHVVSPTSLTTSPLLGDFWNYLPGGIWWHRCGALVLAWRGTRRRDHRESAVFTTVHSGARRTSGPTTSISLSWRKLVASSVLFHTHERGDPYTNLVRVKNENQVAKWKTKESAFSLKDKKSKSSLTLEPRLRNTNFKPILMEEVFRNWMELSSLSEERLIILLQVMNNFDDINYFCMNNYQNKIEILVKLRWKSL